MMCSSTPRQLYGLASFFPYDHEECLPTESPGAPTVYMPSPISGNVLPPRSLPESRDATIEKPSPQAFLPLSTDPKTPPPKSAAERRVQRLSHLVCICGLAAGSLTIATGVVRILKASPSLQWPTENLLDDLNDELWRRKLFLLNPGDICDLWAPIIFGIVSFLTHFRLFDMKAITCNFSHYSSWNLAQALYANYGYCGVLGLVAGVLSTCTSFLSLVSAILHVDGQASLGLEIGLRSGARPPRIPNSQRSLTAIQVEP
ncbi:putative transmembrane protein [Toxoplasma gondii VEG]|uniref:Putative transmembrane protein n=1 Tax=Toxoplasma gondii (strain ATCC 50861 / VEG) TaxID=432359 RepID=B9QKR3_TOXGV|nr:putative transmembrane protein [Toxoplasma gondii VEG]CEL71760.1 TPA: hypothetical protein BN1205_038980 [Toxoplasma gondii VEG]